jgi:ribulose-phosphate 3-epimerase
MFEILPGILEKDDASCVEKFSAIRPFAKSVHIDLLDGKYAPNTTILDPTAFSSYSQDFFLEVHMMVDEPIGYLESFANAGFRRFIGHVERMSDQVAFVAKAERFGEVVLGVDLHTPVDAVRVPLVDLDGVLVMTVKAGFSGQKFEMGALSKVKELRGKDALLPLEIDGGVCEDTIAFGRDAGATRFVATSCLFGSPDPGKQYQKLLTLLNS